MGRARRIQFAGACYLITLRGNNRADIFVSSRDRRKFLGLLKAGQDRCGLKVYAYCLVLNRALMLLETSEPNLSLAMQALGTAYTKYFNSTHGAAGHVFQGRYQALLVDKERWLCETTRYVHLEPARAGLRERPWRYQWSSCPDYVRMPDKQSLVNPDEVLARFGKNRFLASVRYLKWLKERMNSACDIVLPLARGCAIGHESFLERVLARHGAAGADPGGAARLGALARSRIILAEVAARHGLDQGRLTGRMRWRGICAARREAVCRIWKEAQLSVTEISRIFNRTPSAVSQMLRAEAIE